MAKGLDVLNKLSAKVSDYHAKGTKPENPEQHEVEHSDMEKAPHALHPEELGSLEGVLCPSCHEQLKAHMVAKAEMKPSPKKQPG